MIIEYISKNFPAKDVTDGQYLYKSLGSFWTQLFKDKNALQGYTTGMAEELIQSYYKLIEIVNQYSIKNIPLLHKEKWLPLVIKKSEFNKSNFIFEPAGAVFGYQPDTDKFYPNSLFKFGRPKETTNNVYSFQPSISLKKFGLFANRVIAPSLLLLPGVDVLFERGTLFFNSDIFNNPYLPKSKLLGDLGVPSTFVNSDGDTVEDEFIILWTYNAEIDNQELYNNFGILLDIKLSTSEAYKNLLKGVMNLAVEGPTITALSSAFAALANVPIIVESEETVEEIYSDILYKYIITDKNVYRIYPEQSLSDEIKPGNVLNAGDLITGDIKLIDSVISPNWWQREIATDKLAFASHVFAVNAKNQLFFETGISLVTYTNGKLTFPVQGNPEDTQAFQDYINIPSNKLSILEGLGVFENTPILLSDELIVRISTHKDLTKYIVTDKNIYKIPRNKHIALTVVEGVSLQAGTALIILTETEEIENYRSANPPLPIVPTDFVFSNIFKNNTLLLKLSFYSNEQLISFFKLYPLIQQYLPSHVYILIYMNLDIANESLDNLNYSLTIPGFEGFFSADGSLLTGRRPEKAGEDTEYYKDYANRLFCISVGPYKDDLPLHADENLESLDVDNTTAHSTSAGIKCGLMRTDIPSSITPPGESTQRIPSTREIPSILLIDF